MSSEPVRGPEDHRIGRKNPAQERGAVLVVEEIHVET